MSGFSLKTLFGTSGKKIEDMSNDEIFLKYVLDNKKADLDCGKAGSWGSLFGTMLFAGFLDPTGISLVGTILFYKPIRAAGLLGGAKLDLKYIESKGNKIIQAKNHAGQGIEGTLKDVAVAFALQDEVISINRKIESTKSDNEKSKLESRLASVTEKLDSNTESINVLNGDRYVVVNQTADDKIYVAFSSPARMPKLKDIK